ncbi:hypothetical protein SteCoe_40256 [Stentor coeruleus]|uniref:Uncharacterized protein n=1 Tax=Stentor coeruleus TaxID=5963 RepID=A0A1R2AKD8_9CILI|nr:hypothetical protein SteCoe_40256 [Stentor coeruleus]
MPSAFDRSVSPSSGVKMPEQFQAMGFNTNLCILNAGVHLTTLCISLMILLIALFFSYFTRFRNKMTKLIKSYRYGVFLRFWLQSYLELLIIASFGLRYNSYDNSAQKFDYYLCWFILGLEVIGQITFIWCLVKRSKITQPEDITNFEQRFGTFFEEFKSTGPRMWLFYVIFIIRRTLLVINFHFISDLGLQLGISIMSSFCVKTI